MIYLIYIYYSSNNKAYDSKHSKCRVSADQKLKNLINEKCDKLSRYFNRIIEANVYLKIESSGNIKDKSIEMTISVPNKVLSSKSAHKQFEVALDGAATSMERQLKKYKDRMQSNY